MRIRAEKILQMQSRHPEGRMFAKREFNRFPGREQLAAWQFADAYLLFWLHEQKSFAPKGNWLDEGRRHWKELLAGTTHPEERLKSPIVISFFRRSVRNR